MNNDFLNQHYSVNKYENIIKKIGNEGKFQKKLFLIYLLGSFICTLSITTVLINKKLPNYICLESSLSEEISKSHNYIEDKTCVKYYCKNENNFLVIDNSSVYNFVTKLDIFCNIDNFFEQLTVYIFLGRLFGTNIYSYIADKYGRNYSYILMVIFLLISQVCFLISTNKMIILFFSLVSSSCVQLWNLIVLMSVESFSAELYTIANGIFGAVFSLAGIYNIIIFLIFKDLRIILYTNFIITIYLLYLIKIYLYNTTKHLFTKKNFKELIELFNFISTINETNRDSVLNLINDFDNHQIGCNESSSDFNHEKDESPYTLIFKRENMNNILKSLIPFITISYTFYGQLIYIDQLPGDSLLNLLLVFISELISCLIAGYILKRIENRKNSLMFFFSLIGILSFLLCLIEKKIIVSLLIILITMCIGISNLVLMVFLSEYLDVKIKAISISILVNISSIFLIISPYILKLLRIKAFAFYVILCIMCSLNLNFLF